MKFFSIICIIILFFIILIVSKKIGKVFAFLVSVFFAILITLFIYYEQTGDFAFAFDNPEKLDPAVRETKTFLDGQFDFSIIKIKEAVLLDAPLLSQLPELPRGCEVTSLAMLLQFAGADTDKMTLAAEIIKDETPYSIVNGKIYYGDPNDGFIGDMYSLANPGLGVYHKPVTQLAEKYLPGRIKDITGADFQEIKIHLSDGRPVWVITNTSFEKLPDSYFETWHTANGTVTITYKEHAVLVTGYDNDSIYFNDPLANQKNKKAPIADFEKSWVQMGRQAITYMHEQSGQ
ncbi:C39 family peptidase [Bacillaceae bacterium Marseille-Q3522]|nr:C39 family peptidase [Bacillaceae bacterium Marseille-Q3522]